MLSVTPSGSSQTTFTYDALGRMVERNVGGTINEFVYGFDGRILARMSGQTLGGGRVPLPAGGVADYTTGPTLLDYWHGDWLGSVRFASTPSRTLSYDGAVAPYGERYAETGTQVGICRDCAEYRRGDVRHAQPGIRHRFGPVAFARPGGPRRRRPQQSAVVEPVTPTR
jgi:RHS Repeat